MDLLGQDAPIDQLTVDRVRALQSVSFLPASWAKRFVRNMAARVTSGSPTFSPRQAEVINRLCWTYRRQLPTALVPSSKPAGVR